MKAVLHVHAILSSVCISFTSTYGLREHRSLLNAVLHTVYTERRDKVVNTLALYFGGPALKSRPEDRLS
jgi:hypothetical protein